MIPHNDDRELDAAAELDTANMIKCHIAAFDDLPSQAVQNYYKVGFKSGARWEAERKDKEIDRLKRIIAKELSENDELGAEYTYVLALKEEIDRRDKELSEQCRPNGMCQERELKLMAELERLQLNYNLREQEIKTIIDNSDESKWVYWRKERGRLHDLLVAAQSENARMREELTLIRDSRHWRISQAIDCAHAALTPTPEAKGEQRKAREFWRAANGVHFLTKEQAEDECDGEPASLFREVLDE